MKKKKPGQQLPPQAGLTKEYDAMTTYINEPASSKPNGPGLFESWETDPWPEPVITGPLLDLIIAPFSQHVVVGSHERTAIALWTLHAWVHNAAYHSPILAIKSPVKRCGKTTLIDFLHLLVPRPLPTSNLTAPAMFRSVDELRPTLLIDEADTFLIGKDDLRGVLNSGHSRTSAFVLRCSAGNHEPRAYRTWAPKVLALIGLLPETLADRSIIITIQRKRLGEKIARLHHSADILAKCRRMAARWAQDNLENLKSADPDIPATLNDRAADNWRPLLAIADLAGADLPSLARQAAIALSGSSDDDSPSIQLLADIRSIFQQNAVDRLPSKVLLKLLAGQPERPWAEYRHGKPITDRQLAALLGPFEIESRTIRVLEGKPPKGYHCEDFQDAFQRYLSDQPT
jgi:putative DNA primase/helicase